MRYFVRTFFAAAMIFPVTPMQANAAISGSWWVPTPGSEWQWESIIP